MHPALGRGLAIAAIAIGGAAAARVSPAAAQGEPPGRPDSTVRVTLRDGSVIYGRLLRTPNSGPYSRSLPSSAVTTPMSRWGPCMEASATRAAASPMRSARSAALTTA